MMVSDRRNFNCVNVVAAGYSVSMFVSVYKHDHMTCWFEMFQVQFLLSFVPPLASTGSTSCLIHMPPKKNVAKKRTAGSIANTVSGPLNSPVCNVVEVLPSVSMEPELPADIHSLVSPLPITFSAG